MVKYLLIAILTLVSPAIAQDYVCKIVYESPYVDSQGNAGINARQWTGVAISDVLVLSVAHCITVGEALAEFPTKTVAVEVVKFDKPRDLAVFRCKQPHGVTPIKIAERLPRVGKIIGFAMGVRKQLHYPVINQEAWIVKGEPLIVMEGEAFYGMSGGPVITEDGLLAGIQSSGDFGPHKTTMASSLAQIKEFLKGVR